MTERSKGTRFTLLTHSREYEKATNTGRLVKCESIGQENVYVESIVWERKQQEALEQLPQDTSILFPFHKIESYFENLGTDTADGKLGDKGDEAKRALTHPKQVCIKEFAEQTNASVLLIDATWQQAWKIYRQSSILRSLPVLSLLSGSSEYRLRRNQQGLSSVEAVIAVLKLRNQDVLAEQLYKRFKEFMDTYDSVE